MFAEGRPRRLDCRQIVSIGEIETAGVVTGRAEQLRAVPNGRVTGFVAVAIGGQEGIGGDHLGRQVLVDDLVHEGRVGAVLKQAPDEIGEEVAMGPDGGVDPASRAGLFAQHIVQCRPHAVQALKLEPLRPSGHLQHRGGGMGVVGGELRPQPIAHGKQLAGTGDVGDVAGRLAGEDRKAIEPHHLGALDLGVPIGALDQADHQTVVEPPRQGVEPVEHRRRPRTVGLNHHAEPVPAGQCRVAENRFDDIERNLEAFGFLGVDAEADAGGTGATRQIKQKRRQLRHGPLPLGFLVAGMERRHLDRNSGIVAHVVAMRPSGDGVDGRGIGVRVALRVARRQRRLAEHIVGVEVASAPLGTGVIERLVDVAAENELTAEFLHGAGGRDADHRFAEPFQCAAQRPDNPLVVILENLTGQHQRPGRGVDERRGGLSEMGAPVGRCDLVLDQRVDRLGVGRAQQRLGKAHQRHALARRKPVFGQEEFHQAGLRAFPDLAHEVGATGRNALPCDTVEIGQFRQSGQRGALAGTTGSPDRRAKIGERWRPVRHV